ncbi:MAG TPA: hypothetical protein VII23_02480 [Terriglobales bacterium]
MKPFARLALAIAVFLALAGLASAQQPKAEHRINPYPGLYSHSARNVQSGATTSQWSPLNNPICTVNNPCIPPGVTMLLTDGTVLVHEEQDGGEQNWFKLTPDAFGSYVNATWSQVASIPGALNYAPLYFGSQVIADGRLTVIGGEYNFDFPVWTTQGAIYDPVADTWTNVPAPNGWQRTGDAQATNLPNGTYMQASCCDSPPKWAYLNPTTLTWTNFQGGGKFDVFDEEGWTVLPNGKILTVDAYVFQYNASGTNSELYNPTSQTWSSAGSTGPQLWDSHCGNSGAASFEVGPAVLRPDGTVFATGANTCGTGHTAIYNSSTGTWSPGPDFPVPNVSIADGPASIEPNGKVLMMGSVNEGSPSTFFEWDGTSLSVVPGPPSAATAGSFYGHLLPLPTGQILYTDWQDVQIFTPTGTYNPAWAPKIVAASANVTRGTTGILYGQRLSGMTQGGAYGDDYQPSTNYALVRLTNNTTGHVFYCRTHNPSSYAVQNPNLEYTKFDVPTGAETGMSTLQAVTNGIPSQSINVVVH